VIPGGGIGECDECGAISEELCIRCSLCADCCDCDTDLEDDDGSFSEEGA